MTALRASLFCIPLIVVVVATPGAKGAGTLSGGAPIVIGHRGASGYRPEHTLAAYELAIDQGANFVEPDLVSTKDGVLVARHENAIAILNADGSVREATTDVHLRPEFVARKTTKTIDGVPLTGWFTEDFTLAELKTLRAIERLPQLRTNNNAFNGQFEVPTLQEVITLVKQKESALGRPIGIYPETKHPTYFDSIGLSMEEPLVQTLHDSGYVGKNAKVFIQSFEVANLKDLNTKTEVPLVQLLNFGAGSKPYDLVVGNVNTTYADMATAAGLDEIAKYADGVGPNKSYIIPRDAQGNLLAATSFVDDAHAENLLVHPWTFRAENNFLPTNLRSGADPAAIGDMVAELRPYLATGIDGFFTDQPDIGVAAVVPEPASVTLLVFCGASFLYRRRA